jgi:ubiquinone/menaquinone biosynthesis C-methylase UbiE
VDTQFDQSRADAFGDQMLGMLNQGALALLTSVGHRTGLFDVMANTSGNSHQIADAAGLNERYVREWLGGMLMGGIVEYSADADGYSLPAEHAAFVTRGAAPDNVAAFTQYIGLFGTVEDQIVNAFKNGGGVPYSGFPRFQDVMAEDSGQSVLPVLTDLIIPLVDGLPNRLHAGIDALDVGCGRGKALMIMAKEFPESTFLGIDISEQSMKQANEEANSLGLSNLRFEMRDAADPGLASGFDLIMTFDAIHDQARPDLALSAIHAALKPDGVYLMQEIAGSSHPHENIDHPLGPFMYAVSCFHCMTVSLAEGGMGLGAMWGEQKAAEMLEQAGFTQVEVKRLEHDLQNAYYVIQK